jgi:hypothetical protein
MDFIGLSSVKYVYLVNIVAREMPASSRQAGSVVGGSHCSDGLLSARRNLLAKPPASRLLTEVTSG